MCELCELCELLERHPTALAMGFSLFIRSRIYSLAFDSWNARRAIGTARRLLELLERRIAAIRIRVCDGNAMNVR